MLRTTAVVSHFESETFYIPPSLRSFIPAADPDPDQLLRQAVFFLVAPLRAPISLPPADLI